MLKRLRRPENLVDISKGLAGPLADPGLLLVGSCKSENNLAIVLSLSASRASIFIGKGG